MPFTPGLLSNNDTFERFIQSGRRLLRWNAVSLEYREYFIAVECAVQWERTAFPTPIICGRFIIIPVTIFQRK
jgi:hypothetical protein